MDVRTGFRVYKDKKLHYLLNDFLKKMCPNGYVVNYND